MSIEYYVTPDYEKDFSVDDIERYDAYYDPMTNEFVEITVIDGETKVTRSHVPHIALPDMNDFNTFIETEKIQLKGSSNFMYTNGSAITEKQSFIISQIERDLQIKFQGTNSKSAYNFIKKHAGKTKKFFISE